MPTEPGPTTTVVVSRLGFQQNPHPTQDLTAPVTPSLTETPLRPSQIAPTPVTALAALAGATAWGFPDQARDQILATGITLRAQQVLPGDLFAALPSLTPGRPHGADFADIALTAGAVAVLTDAAGAQRPALAGAPVPVLVHPDPR